MVTQADAARWARGLNEDMGWIAPRFARAEPRRRAAAYLRGVLACVERKNSWQLAAAAGDATPDGRLETARAACSAALRAATAAR